MTGCALTVLRTSTPGGATKSFIRARDGALTKTSYAKVVFWNIDTVTVASFEDLARELSGLVEDQAAMVVRGAPKAGLDLSRPQRRKTSGPDATLDDVPRRWLHLDLDNVAAPHLDVIDDPSGAIDYALDLVAAHAPELDGASCFAAFSSSAGVSDPTAAKLHLWFWLDRPYSGDELKRWAARVNESAGFKLIDPQLFVAAQPNYTARPVFVGMPDPLPGRRRWAIRRGYADEAALAIPDQTARRASTEEERKARAAYGPGGGFAFYLSRIDGEGLHGLRDPAMRAMSSRIAEIGAAASERERADIIGAVADALRAARRGGRSEETVAEYIDGLDALFDWLIDRQREREAAARAVPPTYPDAGVPIEDAERETRAAIDQFFARVQKGEKPVVAIGVSTGIGKTELALRAHARSGLRATMLVPRHKLTDELVERAAAMGVEAATWRGREARDPHGEDGSSMCIERRLYEAAKRADAVDEACDRCPSKMRCPYQAQRGRDPARLEIAANVFVTTKPPSAVVSKARPVDVLIIDEDFDARLVGDRRELLLDALTTMPAGLRDIQGADLDAMRAPLRKALAAATADGGPLRIRHLRAAGIDADAARQGEAAEWKALPEVALPKTSDVDELVATLSQMRGRRDTRPAMLQRAVRQFLESAAAVDRVDVETTGNLGASFALAHDDEVAAGAIELLDIDTEAGTAPGVRFRVRHELAKAWRDVPTLILNAATLPSSDELSRIFARPVERVEIMAAMPASVTVTQLVDPAPLSAFASKDGKPKARLRDAADRIEIMAAQYRGQGRHGVDVLAVAGSIEVADLLRDELAGRGLDVAPKVGATRRAAIAVRHCGDLAGEDAYRGVRAMVMVSWCLAPAAALERETGAATGVMPETRVGAAAWPMAAGGLRMRDGSGVAVARPVHPDEDVERRRWRKTEGEMLQAIGRARWSRRTDADPLDLVILSPMPLPGVVVDRAGRWAAIAVDRLEMAFWRLGGVLPLRPDDLVRTGLWPTAKAAERSLEVAGVRRYPPSPLVETILKGAGGISRVDYRRPDQATRWSTALVDASHPPARVVELLRTATGVPDLVVRTASGDPKVAPERSSTAAGAAVEVPKVAPRPLDGVRIEACGTLAVTIRAASPVICAGRATVSAIGAAVDISDQIRTGIEALARTLPASSWAQPARRPRLFACTALPRPGFDPATLRGELRRRGVTLTAFARRVGVSQPHLSNAASGRFRLSGEAVARVVEGLRALPPGPPDLLAWQAAGAG